MRNIIAALLSAVALSCGSACPMPCGEPTASEGAYECAVMVGCNQLWTDGKGHPMFGCACMVDYSRMDKPCKILFQDLAGCLSENGCYLNGCLDSVPFDFRKVCNFRFE